MSQTTPDPEYPQPTRPTAGDDGGAYVPQPDAEDPAEGPAEGEQDVDEESQDGDERGESKRP